MVLLELDSFYIDCLMKIGNLDEINPSNLLIVVIVIVIILIIIINNNTIKYHNLIQSSFVMSFKQTEHFEE